MTSHPRKFTIEEMNLMKAKRSGNYAKGPKVDITGRRFGRWTVLRWADMPGSSAQWVCQCDCGTISHQRYGVLASGETESCGCIMAESRRFRAEHRLAYHAWKGMRQRCNNKNHPQYKDYGGRGISVCERWNDFKTFLSDMGDAPRGMTIDRIENSAGYCPENCRWATRTQQNRNKRSNRIVSFHGQIGCVSEICEKFGLPRSTISNMLNVQGLSFEQAASKIFNRTA